MRESVATGMQAASEWRPPAARRWREKDAREMARAFAASGESKAAFAKRHGLDEERVRRWLRTLEERDAKRDTGGPAFAPVRVVERAPERRGGIEIIVGKRVVRVGVGFCPEALRQVLAALEEAAC